MTGCENFTNKLNFSLQVNTMESSQLPKVMYLDKFESIVFNVDLYVNTTNSKYINFNSKYKIFMS